MVYQEDTQRATRGHADLHDVTVLVARIAEGSGVRQGMVNSFNIGSTASVGTIEFEPGLEPDLPTLLDRLIPSNPHYGHEQAWHDGYLHLQATWLEPSLTLAIYRGAAEKLAAIFHLDAMSNRANAPECGSLWRVTIYGG